VPRGEANEAALEAVLARESAADMSTPLDPAKEARKRSIASAIATEAEGFDIIEHDYAEVAEEQDLTEEEARRRLRHVRCDNGTLLVEVEDEHTRIQIPYASSLVGEELAADVFEVLRLLNVEARLVPYDPQLGRELDLDADRDAFLEEFRRRVERARREGAEERVDDRPKPRWWQRLLPGG
jgi:hypothetical protein